MSTESTTQQSFTCPRCGATSHNPNDVRAGYCGRCHDWTGTDGDATAWVVSFAAECRYLAPTVLPDGIRYAVIAPMAYTTAIIVGEIGDRAGYLDRWCYENITAAAVAFAAWDGDGEPVGWHRHPASGRRVSRDPDEIDDDGNRVGAIGVTYVWR